MTDCSQISCVPAPFHPASPLLDGRELDGNTFTGYFPPELLPLLGLGEPDLSSFKVQVMFSSRRRQLWAGGGSDISLGVKWGSYFIITDYFLKLGVENTTHAWQVGWWESERWLRLLLVRGGGGHSHFRLQLCRCHPMPMPLPARAPGARLFIALLPPGVFI